MPVIRYTIEDVRKVFSDAGCTLISTEYKNTETKLQYICNCGSQTIHLISVSSNFMKYKN